VTRTDGDTVSFFGGLSLGQASEYTGLAVLEKRTPPHRQFERVDASYAVRHLARFPPGTAYGEVLAAVTKVFADPPVANGTLMVDQTGVGRAVFELVRDSRVQASVHAVTVTAAHAGAWDDRGTWLVPKKDLVGVLQLLLQGRRLKVAPALAMAQTLAAELQQFKLKAVPMTADAAVEWRERPHDDLVLAVAVAAWEAERPGVNFYFQVVTMDPPVSTPSWTRRW
jgi:hypothetical protein